MKDVKQTEDRRAEVVRLYTEERLTQPQIAAALKISLGTVNNDLKAYRARLQQTALPALAEYQAKQVTRYEALYELAYEKAREGSAGYITAAVSALTRIDKLLGLEAPAKTEVTGANGGPVEQVIINIVEATDALAAPEPAPVTGSDDGAGEELPFDR